MVKSGNLFSERKSGAIVKLVFVYFWMILFFTSCSKNGVDYIRMDEGIQYQIDGSVKRILFYGDNLVRISQVKEGMSFSDSSLAVIAAEKQIDFSVDENKIELILKTPYLSLTINKKTGAVEFYDAMNRVYLKEHNSMLPEMIDITIQDASYFQVKQAFQLTDDEGLYGLGQFQNGFMNYRGKDLLLVQANKIAIVPVLVSTRNYGILWDNYSKSYFHDGEDATYFKSEVADQIDYYFIGSASIDGVIAGYRTLTGKAPLFAAKAYGFWQSKERYTSFDELLNVVDQYRENNIPIDNIVQDWRYWGNNHYWSSMYFKGNEFAEPTKIIQKLHDKNVDLMVSIWPVLGDSSKIYKEMDEQGFLYNQGHWAGGKVYDAYNPVARDIYWKHVRKGLAEKGVDAYWMDGTEPEFFSTETQESTESEILKVEQTAAGPIAKYLNTYALVTSDGLYQQHRDFTQDKRVFILTRSSWAGQQRNATVTWSGDVSADFGTFGKQISAGINFCMTGVPYWTHDIGAFFPSGAGGMYPGGIDDPAYQELYVRWFQFGAFTPIFRSHGTGTPREVWRFKDRNPEFYNALRKVLHLRYQLFPYVYSNAWQVSVNDYTLMRGLVMDFSEDKNTYDIADQYMFGSSLLVKPVTKNMYFEIPSMVSAIPVENLRTKENKEGLSATYFADTEFGKIAFERIDKGINYDWSGGGLPPGVPEHYFSVRWEGALVPDKSGEHSLVFSADDGVRVWINNELVIDEWQIQGETSFEHLMDLNSEEKYPIKIEYFQAEGGAVARLAWETPTAEDAADMMHKAVQTYLPDHLGWFDFWNNAFYQGKQTVTGEYPIDIFPLFVKAGSIIPMATKQQYIGEKPYDPIEIRIYAGDDASFVYYEDEGNSYNYEKGDFNTIDFNWDEAMRVLIIGKSNGNFTGFRQKKKFYFKLIEPGTNQSIVTTKELDYNGDRVQVSF